MRVKLSILLVNILVILFSFNNSYVAAQENNKSENEVINAETSKNKEESFNDNVKKNKLLKLNVNTLVDYLLKNNYDVKKALLDYKGANSPLLQYQAKYDFIAIGNGGYSHTENPNAATQSLQGKYTDVGNYMMGLQKNFSSGTTVGVNMTGIYQNIATSPMTIPGFPVSLNLGGGVGYQTNFKVDLSQELVKNAFGINDRLTEQSLKNITFMNKQLVKMKLTAMLVDFIIGYWNIAIAEEFLNTNRIIYNGTVDIRNLMQRKAAVGLAEAEEAYDWNSRTLAAKNNLDKSEKSLFDARLNILRSLNLDSDINIEVGRTFNTEEPTIKYEQAVKDAFIKRIDWNNQKVVLNNANLDLRIAANMNLPSLKLKASAGLKDYDATSYANTFDTFVTDYAASLELTYPIGDTGAYVKLRDAKLNYQKQYITLQSMEQNIRDEIVSIVKQCDVSYQVFQQTKQSRDYAQNYYYQVLAKFKKGKYNSVQLKMAMDSFAQSKMFEIQSLIDYNISLLRRDFSRNTVFENYNIDVDGILKRIDN